MNAKHGSIVLLAAIAGWTFWTREAIGQNEPAKFSLPEALANLELKEAKQLRLVDGGEVALRGDSFSVRLKFERKNPAITTKPPIAHAAVVCITGAALDAENGATTVRFLTGLFNTLSGEGSITEKDGKKTLASENCQCRVLSDSIVSIEGTLPLPPNELSPRAIGIVLYSNSKTAPRLSNLMWVALDGSGVAFSKDGPAKPMKKK